MGFFSELKSDLSQAAKTMLPDDNDEAQILKDKTPEVVTPSKAKSEAEVKKDLNEMLDHLDEIKLDDGEDAKDKEPEQTLEEKLEKEIEEVIPEVEEKVEESSVEEAPSVDAVADLTASLSAAVAAKVEEKVEIPEEMPEEVPVKEESYISNYNNGGFGKMDIQQQTPTDETASITEGMKIVGNLETTGSLDLIGKIAGNVTCLGKLNVTGEIEGDSKAAEIYAEAARITGEVRSQGSVKIGQSTVVIGNIFATSAVIAGAVKGDIDVPGPVVLDTTAIVMGNIKSQSVQINNGAVIEGNCSQSYAEVNPSAFFDGLKGTK